MRTAGKRLLYFVVGVIAVLLRVLGVLLPGLPTVPFILVALWAFSRSSARVHGWLLGLPILKNVHREIDLFQEQRSLELRTKIIAQAAAWSSFVVCTLILRNVWVSLALALVALVCSIFMLSVKTRTGQSLGENPEN